MQTQEGHGENGRATAEFATHLRRALNRLYDPTYMRRSPLAALFRVADRVDTPSSLQRILIDAIQALKPRASEPTQSLSWCIYNLLCLHYIQQLDQQQVANQLGIGERTMRRRQHLAVRALADYLWKQLELEGKLEPLTGLDVPSSPLEPGHPNASDALAWLRDTQHGGAIDLAQALAAALDLFRPLAAQHNVRLQTDMAGDLPRLAAHPVALKQIILNLLHMAMHQAVGGEMILSARPLARSAEIVVRCTELSPSRPLSDEDTSLLSVTRQLVDLCRGTLALSAAVEAFSTTVILPAFEQLVILAVDDQPDTLQLLERYVSNTRYHLVGTRDPAQAVSLAEKYSPWVMVVDIMMPDVDGWSVLAMLRQHPLTRHTPIIVCTVLPQKELAMSLGADTFIQKPLSRQAFLDAVDRLTGRDQEIGPRGPESH